VCVRVCVCVCVCVCFRAYLCLCLCQCLCVCVCSKIVHQKGRRQTSPQYCLRLCLCLCLCLCRCRCRCPCLCRCLMSVSVYVSMSMSTSISLSTAVIKKKISKVSSLLSVLCEITTEQTCQDFYFFSTQQAAQAPQKMVLRKSNFSKSSSLLSVVYGII